jgi:WD40-like Beta Propeller Repeat
MKWTRPRAVAVAAVAAAIVAGCTSAPASHATSPPATSARPAAPVPRVDETAFAGHGELAFASRGELWVLDGATGTVHHVPAPGITPLDPAFSRDGRWLSFLGTSPSAQGSYSVWLASGDGSGARQVVATGALVGWSPAADVLAVTAGNLIRLIDPAGSARTLVRAPGIGPAVWSPDGSSIAVSIGSASAGTLASYPVAGGRPATWLRISASSSRGNYLIDPAGWWRDQGIVYWAQGDCASCNADGDPLYVIRSPGAHPRLLGTTLADSSLDQVTAAPDGPLAIVAEIPGPGMGGRLIWQDRTVQVCGPRARCTGVPARPSTVALDPAWSPDGRTLALVRAPDLASAAFPQNVVAAWYAAHQLWLYDPAHRSLRELNASGATVPLWSASGTSMLYVAQDGIWLLPSLTGRPVRIAGPLFPPGNWPTFYGQVNWLSQFAWWQR